MRETNDKSVDAARIARLNMLNSMDGEAKNDLKKKKLMQYQRRNQVPQVSQGVKWGYHQDQSDSMNKQVSHNLRTSQTHLPPNPTASKDVDLNIDVTNVLAKVTVLVPLSELIKIPFQIEKVR